MASGRRVWIDGTGKGCMMDVQCVRKLPVSNGSAVKGASL